MRAIRAAVSLPCLILRKCRGKRIWLRTVVLPAVNDTPAALDRYLDVVAETGVTVERYELLAFHTMGFAKYESLGLVNPLADMSAADAAAVAELQRYVTVRAAGGEFCARRKNFGMRYEFCETLDFVARVWYTRCNSNKSKQEENHMAYKISDACVSCGTCAGECPVEAISAGDTQYNIDPDKCVDCGTCASVCPTEAINPED